jgi:signal transduction histidine kinase
VTITDDGVGIDVARPPGRGLPGMRRRAQVLGGDVSVDSSASGTTVTLRFPLARSVAA